MTNKLIFRLILWLFLEIGLTILELDDIADYSEFIFAHQVNIEMVKRAKKR